MSVTRQRWSVAILLVAVALSFWTARWLARDRQRPPPLPMARSDYALRDFDLVVMNSAGLPSLRVQAPYLEKSPTDGSLKLQQPNMWLFESGDLRWESRADHGWIRADGEEVLLTGEVELQEQAEGDLLVQTSRLSLYPEAKLARSDAAVRLLQTGMRMTGVGLDADLKARRFELLSEVKGQYVPN